MSGLPTLFSDRLMFASRKDFSISIPEITVSATVFVGIRDTLLQLTTTGFITVTDKESHNLARATT